MCQLVEDTLLKTLNKTYLYVLNIYFILNFITDNNSNLSYPQGVNTRVLYRRAFLHLRAPVLFTKQPIIKKRPLGRRFSRVK
jgi:hypothetical protein